MKLNPLKLALRRPRRLPSIIEQNSTAAVTQSAARSSVVVSTAAAEEASINHFGSCFYQHHRGWSASRGHHLLSSANTIRHRSTLAVTDGEYKEVHRLLYRKCRKVLMGWSPQQLEYALEMEGIEALVRPSLRAALPHMSTTMSTLTILRFIFQFRLPTDTDKMRMWGTQAAFSFLRRSQQAESERKLLSGWSAIASRSFTPLDAAVLVAYIHRHFNPIRDPIVPQGMEDYNSQSRIIKRCTILASLSEPPQQAQGGSNEPVYRTLVEVLRDPSVNPELPLSAASTLPSLDAFTEPILVRLESIIERCRVLIPSKERAHPERHGKLIVKSVLDVLRWESVILAYKGQSGGSEHAALNAIDEALLRRRGSQRLVAVIVAHVLCTLGVRAVALCDERLPLVCIYSHRHKGKLQCCVDIAHTSFLGPEETKAALRRSLGHDVPSPVLIAKLLRQAESVVAQAAAFLTCMKADPNLSPEEQHIYDKAARFVAAVVAKEHHKRRELGP